MKSIDVAFLAVPLSLVLAFVLNDAEVLSLLSFAWEGFLSITWPGLVAAISGGKPIYERARKRCYKDLPGILQESLRKLEEQLTEKLEETNDNTAQAPVREIHLSDPRACQDTLSSTEGGRLTPFIVRGNEQFEEFSPEWLSKRGTTSVLAMDMKTYGATIQDIAQCPYKRKNLTRQVPLSSMPNQSHFYANFNRETLKSLYGTLHNTRFQSFVKNHLQDMCQAFGGTDGELFFGFSKNDSDSTLGTGFHCASMENLFLQVHGERNWTLVDPQYTMRMRPMHGFHYVIGTGLYDEGWNTVQRPSHWNAIPKLTVTTKPGDILFIPPWWWHEIRIEPTGFTLGISNRNSLRFQSWRDLPIIRFLPGVRTRIFSNKPLVGAGLTPIVLDLVHYTPFLLVMLLSQLGILSDHDRRQLFESVQGIQHANEFP